MRSWLFVACVGVVLNVLIWPAVLAPPSVTVEPLTVEKGSAVLIEDARGTRLLVGTGADASVLRALGETLFPWQRNLAAIILPSMSAADSGGIALVLERYRTRAVLRPAREGTRARETVLAKAAAKSGAQVLLTLPGGYAALPGGAQLLLSSGDEGSLSTTLSYGSTTIRIASTTSAGRYARDGARLPLLSFWPRLGR